jgi:hypothetical protein
MIAGTSRGCSLSHDASVPNVTYLIPTRLTDAATLASRSCLNLLEAGAPIASVAQSSIPMPGNRRAMSAMPSQARIRSGAEVRATLREEERPRTGEIIGDQLG